MSFSIEETLNRLRYEYLESTVDKLDDIGKSIDEIHNGNRDANAFYIVLRREIHSMKGSAGTFGFHSVSVIAHRLEDYLAGTELPTASQLRDTEMYLDAIRNIIESGIEPSEDGRFEILATLPVQRAPGFSEQDRRQITSLLVMPKSVRRSVIGEELRACGFDVSFSERSLEAVNLAISLRPQVVISSYELPDINGDELAQVLAVVRKTKGMPFILVTSHDANSRRLSDIPAHVRVVKKGPKLVEDITECLIELGLFGAAGHSSAVSA